jgi:LPXTG-motif cell wall-anchored protein
LTLSGDSIHVTLHAARTTATIASVSSSVTIEVRPRLLANSGVETVLPVAAGGVLLLAGAALLIWRRRRTLVED